MDGHVHRPTLSSALRAVAALAAGLLIAASPSHALADRKPATSTRTAAATPKKKAPAKPPLNGATHDYNYDAKDIGRPERAWRGRAFIHQNAAGDAEKPLPIVVFIHGLNTEAIPFRWMGGGNEGDVRRIVGDLIEGGSIPPVLLAAPSSVIPAATTNALTSWPAFDIDRFLDITAERLRGVASIDRSRVIVAGHSGGGCNKNGGLASAVKGKTRPLAALAIDTCMGPDVATELARAHPDTHVVVSWQTLTWTKRPIAAFKDTFLSETRKAPANPGIIRLLEQVTPKEPMPHDAMVGVTLKTWLPKLLSAPAQPAPQNP